MIGDRSSSRCHIRVMDFLGSIEKLNEIIKELVKEKEEDKERFNGIIGGLVAQMEKEKEEKEAILVRMTKIEAMLTTSVRK
ncbi:hypothetical protein Hanom_Chr07g00601691 [Helianthus anomalus]